MTTRTTTFSTAGTTTKVGHCRAQHSTQDAAIAVDCVLFEVVNWCLSSNSQAISATSPYYIMTEQNDNLLQPPLLLQRKSSHSLLAASGASTTADATTAITLASAEPELTIYEEEATLNRDSAGSVSSPLHSIYPSDDEIDNTTEGTALGSMLHELMLSDVSRTRDMGGVSTLNDFNVFIEDKTAWDEQFLELKVFLDKLCSLDVFRGKLKQFFILSTAGKPIYSMNGDDDVILGYMGLITTIVGTFQESSNSDFKSISQDGFKMVVMNRSPLILVAISKVIYEIVPSTGVGSTTDVLETQLGHMYNYVLAVLSKPIITKNFQNRMNYDLRRMLNAQDSLVLDTLCMNLTYGFHRNEDEEVVVDSPFYLGALLGGALQCAKISNTSRQKLNNILLATKKLKTAKEDSDHASVILNTFGANEHTRLLASDLLFGFLTLGKNIISLMRPKNHKLGNKDIITLLTTVEASWKGLNGDQEAAQWIPLCMPNFNDTGFLYVHVRRFTLDSRKDAEPISVILLSGNRNSFFELKACADYIVHRIKMSKTLTRKLGPELAEATSSISLLKEVRAPVIKHFIYKRKDYNQFYTDDLQFSADDSALDWLRALTHIIYFYTALANCKATMSKKHDPKKLTYTRWQLQDDCVTGFMLADEKSEFYCLCGGSVQAQAIIDQSLKVIQWCERYNRRLFVGDGVSF